MNAVMGLSVMYTTINDCDRLSRLEIMVILLDSALDFVCQNADKLCGIRKWLCSNSRSKVLEYIGTDENPVLGISYILCYMYVELFL